MKLARLLMPVVVLGTSILVPTPRVDATGGLACGEEPVTIEPDGAVSSGSKAELTKAVRAGLPIRVGWELDWNEDGNVDVTHWAEAIFLTLFEDEVFTQIADIHRQIPRTGEKRIDLSSRPQRWTASIGTNGVLASRFDDEPVTERRVKSFWCVDER